MKGKFIVIYSLHPQNTELHLLQPLGVGVPESQVTKLGQTILMSFLGLQLRSQMMEQPSIHTHMSQFVSFWTSINISC